ncbi:MAG TPA: tetratricopeptide repeat protein [Dehalococcoidia bacterium]
MNRTSPSSSPRTANAAPVGAVLRRERILDKLTESLAGRLTLVVAPAGFGKTAALRGLESGLERPLAWLDLRDWHREPRELLDSLARALDPAAAPAIDPGASISDLRRQLRLLLWSAANEVPSAGSDAVAQGQVLVLDDVQSLGGAAGACALLEEFLESAPKGWHVVIASRQLPRLRAVSRLMTAGAATYFGVEDLRFDADDAVAYFREVRGLDLAPDRAREVIERTAGWPAEVALIGLGADGAPDYASRAAIFLDDLLDETFQRLSPALRTFLTSTSVLPSLDASTCDSLLSRTDSFQMLREAEQAQAFICAPAAGGGPTLVPAFRRLLKQHLRASKPAVFASLSRSAGDIYASDGEWEAAIPIFLDAGLWSAAATALVASADTLLSYGNAARVGDWLDALPGDLPTSNAELQLLRARTKLDVGEIDAALEALAGLIDNDCPPSVRGKAFLYRATCLSRKGLHPEAIRSGRTAVAELTSSAAPRRLQAEAHLRLGNCIGASGQFARSIPSLRRALAIADDMGAVQTASIAADDLGVAFGNLGEIPQAQVYLERARRGWAELGNDYRLVLTLNNLGVMYSLQGEYDSSAEILREAIERSQRSANARIEAFATLSLADVDRDTGHYEAAIELYNAGLEKARHLGETYFVDYAVDALGMTYMLMGDLGTAEQLIKQTAAEVAERGGAFQNGLLSLSLGILSHLRAEFVESAARLEYALQVFKDAGAAREEARAHFHLAHVYLATNSRRKALAALEEVVRLVKAIGYGAFLAADARRCPALTAFASSKRLGDGVFAKLRDDQARRGLASELGLTPAYPRLEAFGFGDSRVLMDGRLITEADWSSAKSKEMFFYFLTQARPCSRDECCAALWPEFDPARATSNFHSTLYRLRSATYFDVLSTSNGRYRLNPAASFDFDVRRFEAAVAAAEDRNAGADVRMAAFDAAISLYEGPFAKDCYSEWTDEVRIRLEEKYLRGLAVLALNALALGSYERGVALADRILLLDDTNDEAHCLKIESFAAMGDRVSAVRHFEAYRRLSRARTGPPSERLTTLARRLAAGLN